MPRIFLSYASIDRPVASRLRDQLLASGWQGDEIFQDTRSIASGARWKQALRDAMRRCEAVIFLVSDASLDSTECRVETRVAEETGKPVFPVLIGAAQADDPRLASFQEYQLVRLQALDAQAFDGDGFGKLVAGLDAIGLTPGRFAWHPAGGDLANPYPGLRSYTDNEAGIFFGRELETERCLAQIRALHDQGSGVLAIVGSSGAGKSSFLRAAVWPRLQRDARFSPTSVLRPAGGLLHGRHGLLRTRVSSGDGANLEIRDSPDAIVRSLRAGQTADVQAGQIAPASSHLGAPLPVLAIDQGEELLSLTGDAARQAQALLAALKGDLAPSLGTAGMLLLLAIRADRLDQFIEYWSAMDLPLPTLMPLPAVPVGRYRDIILKPAEVARQHGLDVTVDPALADHLIAESAGADALPLMALTLRELSELQGPRPSLTLLLQDYNTLGGLGGIVGHQLAGVEQRWGGAGFLTVLRDLLLPDFIGIDPDTGEARRKVASPDGWAPDRQRLADAMVDARLLVRDGDQIEIAHEVLLRHPPISDWIAEDTDFLAWMQNVTRARMGHAEGNRGLLVGRELDIASEHLTGRPDMLSAPDQAFVDQSLYADTQRRAQERQQAQDLADARTEAAHTRELAARRVARRTGLGLAAALVLLAFAVVFGISANREADRADRSARLAAANAQTAETARTEAERQADIARGREMVGRARALFDRGSGRNSTAGLIAAEALLMGAGTPALDLISDVLAVTPREWRELPPGNRILSAPDGKRYYILRQFGDSALERPGKGTAVALDTKTGDVLAKVEQQGWPQTALSPDGRWMAVGGEGRRLQLVDLRSGTVLVDEKRDANTAVVFSGDSTALHILDSRNRFQTRTAPDWTVTETQRLSDPAPQRYWLVGQPVGLERSSNGAILALLTDQVFLRPPGGTFGALEGLAKKFGNKGKFDPAGQRFVVGNGTKALQIRDAMGGRVTGRIQLSTFVGTWDFSPDGKQIALGAADGAVDIYDAETARLLRTIDTATVSVADVRYVAANQISVLQNDGRMRIFETTSGAVLRKLPTVSGYARIMLDTARHRIFLGSGNGVDVVGPDTSPDTLYPVTDSHGARPVDVSADGRVMVIDVLGTRRSSSWNEISAYDAQSLEHIWTKERAGPLEYPSISADGRTIATLTRSIPAEVTLWNTETGQRRVVAGSGIRKVIGFSPDGERLVVDAGAARILDVDTGRVLHDLGEPSGIRGIATGHDGTVFYTFGSGEVRAWDAKTFEQLWQAPGKWPGGSAVSSGTSEVYLERVPGDLVAVKRFKGGPDIAQFPVTDINFRRWLSPDGTRALTAQGKKNSETGMREARVELWDATTGKRVISPLIIEDAFPRLGFDYSSLVWLRYIKNGRNTTVILDAKTGSIQREYPDPRGYYAFNPSKSNMNVPYSYVSDSSTKIWFPDSGREATLPAPIALLAVSPDGKTAIGHDVVNRNSKGKDIVLVDLETMTVIWQAPAVTETNDVIGDLMFTSDGQRILSFTRGEQGLPFVKVYAVANGRIIATLRSKIEAWQIEALADPDLVLVHFADMTAAVMRLSTGDVLARFNHARSTDRAVIASQADRIVTTLGTKVRLWDTRTGRPLAAYDAPAKPQHLTISPDGQAVSFFVATTDRRLRDAKADVLVIWRADREHSPVEIIVPDSAGRLTFSADGAHLAAVLDKSRIRIWDTQSGAIRGTLVARPGSSFGVPFQFDDDANLVMVRESSPQGALRDSAGKNRPHHIRVWRFPSLTEIARVEGIYDTMRTTGPTLLDVDWRGGLAIDPSTTGPKTIDLDGFKGRRPGKNGWLIAETKTSVRARHITTGQELGVQAALSAESIRASAFTDDYAGIYIAERRLSDGIYEPGTVRFLSTKTGAALADPVEPGITVTALRVAADGALLLGSPGGLARYGRYSQAKLWRLKTGDLHTLEAKSDIGSFAVSPDGSVIALGEGYYEKVDDRWQTTGEPKVSLWDGKTGAHLSDISLKSAPIAIAFLGNGSELAIRTRRSVHILGADYKRTADASPLLDTRFQRRSAQKIESLSYGARIVFTAYGWTVLTKPGGVRVMSPRTGQEIFLPHAGTRLPVLTLSDDGKRLLSRVDSVARIWQIPKDDGWAGDPMDLLLGTASVPKPGSLFFFGQDYALYQAREAGLVRLPYQTNDLVGEVCNRIGRGLTPTEKELFFGAAEARDPCAPKGG